MKGQTVGNYSAGNDSAYWSLSLGAGRFAVVSPPAVCVVSMALGNRLMEGSINALFLVSYVGE